MLKQPYLYFIIASIVYIVLLEIVCRQLKAAVLAWLYGLKLRVVGTGVL